MSTLRERPASMRYIEKFGRVVLIDDEHPLTLAQRAQERLQERLQETGPGVTHTGDTPRGPIAPAPAVASAPESAPADPPADPPATPPLTSRTRRRR